MPVLAFKVQADWEKVVRLREEIKKLKAEMKGIDAVNSPHQFNTLNQRLRQCTSEFNSLTNEAIKAGAQMEGSFKKKIYDAQQTVNGLSEEIIKQRKIIAETSDELKQLSNRYKELKRNGQNMSADAMLPQINRVKGALDEQKYALFELTQERAKEQISVKKLREEYQLFAKDSDAGVDALAKMKSQLLGMGKGLLAGMGLKELGAEIIRVRGQFQQADAAIATLLGSEERAKDLLSQVREYAKISPLEFGDITAATQMMLGFNVEAEKVPGFIRAIGDVSMGESGKFNSLTLAFSQMSATGKLMGQDLNQMINAGFNPLSVMAEKTGKSIAQLKEEMSKGAITSEMVQQAFIDATSAGGKFFNMSENAAKTINGQISMMHDALDSALNDIGTKSEGIIVTGISGITKLIESYETVGRVVMGLATTYGFYRTAVALVTFAENGHTLAMTMARAQILLTQKAQALLNATMLANPYVLAAVALGGLIGTLVATSDTLNAAEHAQKNFDDTVKKNSESIQKEKEEIDNLIKTLTDETEAQGKRDAAYQKLKSDYPEIFSKYRTEKELIDNLTEARQRENAEIERKNRLLTQQQYDDAKQRAKDLRRLAQLTGKQLTNEESKEASTLRFKYQDYIAKNGKGLFGYDVNKAADAAEKEYQLNIDANRKRQISERNAKVGELSKAQAQAEKKRIEAAIKAANEAGKKYISIGGSEPITIDQAKDYVALLDGNINTTRKTMKQWRADAKEESKKNKKAAQDLANSTELLTKEQAEKKMDEANKKLAASQKAEKNFDVQDKAGAAAAKKAAQEAKKKAEAEEKMAQIKSKQQLAEQRAAKDIEFSTREAEIKAMKDGTAKKLAQIELDRDKELEAISRSYEDIRVKRIEEAKRVWDADPKNKGKNFYDSDAYQKANVNTKAETDNYEQRVKTAKVEYQRSSEEIQKSELSALYDYLEEYGTYQQKKLAITEKFNEKISKAETQGEKMTLQRQMEKALSDLDMSQLKQNINWEAVFNDLDKVSLEHLQKLKENLKLMLYSDDISAENAKVISERIGAINTQIATKQKEWQSAFGLVIPELERIRQLRNEEKEAQERLEQAQKRQNKALAEEAKARKEIVELAKKEGITIDSSKVTTEGQGNIFAMFQNAGKDTSKLADLFEKLGKKESKVAESTENLSNAEVEAGEASEAAGSSFATTVAIIDKIVHGINDNVQSANELFEQMGLADTKFGKGFSNFAESSKYATEAWESLKSGNIMGVANGVYGSLRTLGNAIGEWGGGSLFGDSDTNLAEDIERLTNSNQVLKRAINNLSDKMSDSAVADAEGIYKQQKDNLAKAEKNTREMMQRSASAYSNGFLGIGGSHSSNAKIDDGVKSSEWSRISQLLGKNVKSAGDFFNLTSEQMYRVATELPDIYAHIKDLANDGYKDAAQYMDGYIEYWKQLQELEDAYLQKLTSTSFDSIQSDFANALMDMDSDAESFADKFEGYMQQAIINSLVSEQYRPLLEKWYKAFGAFIKGGRIDEEEMRRLKQTGGSFYDETTGTWQTFQSWDDITKSALAARDSLKDVFGWGDEKDKEQSATSNAIQNITQDQANALEGRITAMQIAVEQGNTKKDETNAQLTLTNMTLADLRSVAVEHREIADDTRDILANSYLELREINEHQDKIEKAVVALQTDVEEMKDDIKHLR